MLYYPQCCNSLLTLINSSIIEFTSSINDLFHSSLSAGLKLLNKILYYLEHLYIICQEEGFAPILDEWRKYSITLNQHIRVIGTNEVLEGIAVDIDDDGALLVNIDGQITRVLAGDVSIRPVQNR